MKLIIDFDLLEKEKITVDQFLFLYKLYLNSKHNVDDDLLKTNLTKKLLIKCINPTFNLLLNRGKEFVESHIIKDKSKKKVVTFDDIDKFLNEEYRVKWKDLGPGLMGSLKSCRENLSRWMKENPQYTFDDISKAADMYLQQQNNVRYIQRADYFIRKIIKGVEHSRLSEYIEQLDNFTDENWTIKMN